jgi:hypothetical protein
MNNLCAVLASDYIGNPNHTYSQEWTRCGKAVAKVERYTYRVYLVEPDPWPDPLNSV